MKNFLRTLVGLLTVILLILGAYVAYLFIDYDRLPDEQELITTAGQLKKLDPSQTSYTATSFNIGYAAHTADYSFFMDGGKYSRAYDKETVLENLDGITENLKQFHSDFLFLQEVDTWAHRSFKVNQVEHLEKELKNYDSVFGQNYDSSYLFYPFLNPIGKSKSGLLTMSQFPMTDSIRYSVPIETDFNKFFDLDRSFTVTQTSIGERPITLINVHLSAFTEDTTILDNQIKKLAQVMEAEYQNGRSVIVGGDYNHDLLGNSPEVFGTEKIIETWTHPFPENFLSENFSVVTKDFSEAKIPTVRANGTGYTPGETFVSLIDGFIVSKDIHIEKTEVHDLGFANSDHNPVTITFSFQ